MQKPCCFSHASRESFQIWVLLADCFVRCRRTHSPVHKLPVLQQAAPRPGPPPYYHTTLMAVRMLGPLTTALGDFTHMLVAIDKFTKWIKYKPIAKLSVDRVVSFICDILHRFSFPNTIITDLGSNFHSH
jgi:hypothetical protein